MGEEQRNVTEAKLGCDAVVDVASEPTVDGNKPADVIRAEQILKAKELYSHGSRNFLVKSYADAAEELSEVCRIYDDLYGNLSDELGMPYLLYAKSLIALALDENKVVDVPYEDDDDEDDEEDDEVAEAEANGEATTSLTDAKLSSEKPLGSIKEGPEPENKGDVSDDGGALATEDVKNCTEEAIVTCNKEENTKEEEKLKSIVFENAYDEKPSTSKGQRENGDEEIDAENEATSNLQLAWEVLELADKIFSSQGSAGLPNLAEVKTELANISFENNALETARIDYEKALKIYDDLPNSYRRAKAEIHYKIGLIYLMQLSNKNGAESLKKACSLIDSEIMEIKSKKEQTDKDKNTVQDLEETKQEIWVKIAEIEETESQTVAEVRAALDSYIKPFNENKEASCDTGSSSSSSAIVKSLSANSTLNSSKPTDISHLIKRKKCDDPQDENVDVTSAKKAAVQEN